MVRRFGSRRIGSLVSLLLAAIFIALRLWWSGFSVDPPAGNAPAGVPDASEIRVERVVDGDTLLVGDHVRVRLIGTNTPETVKPDSPVEPWGPEASEFTKQFVAGGMVRLEFDGDRFDRHGRTLAYVWVGERMLNEELIRAGLGRFEPQYHYSENMKRRFAAAQSEAQAEHRGIWSTELPGLERRPSPNKQHRGRRHGDPQLRVRSASRLPAAPNFASAPLPCWPWDALLKSCILEALDKPV